MSKSSLRGKIASSLRGYGILLWLLPVCALWVALSQIQVLTLGKTPHLLGPDGALGFLERKTFSARLFARGEIPSPINLRYVDIDSHAIAEFGNFPWNCELYATALRALFEKGGVKAVGFDLIFSKQSNLEASAKEGSLNFGRAIKKYGNVVLAATYNTEVPEIPEFPIFGPTWGQIGLIDTLANDYYLRLFAERDGATHYSMALQLALDHWGLDSTAVSLASKDVLIRKEDGTLQRRIPTAYQDLVEPNWFLPWNSPQNYHVSFLEILRNLAFAESGSPEEKTKAAHFFASFRDAVVLIGPTDLLMKDLSQTPIDGSLDVPRVSLHGNMLKTIISGRFLQRLPAWANSLIIALLGFATALLCLQEKRAGWKKIAAGLLILLYITAAFLVFAWLDLLVPIVAPVGNALSCSFLAVLWQLGVEQRQRNRIKLLFGSYVSAEIVNEMVDRHVNPQVGGAEVEITAFFSDIEAFSPLSEELSPSELVDLMSQYLGECTTAITWHSGTLDKYVGDAIIAIFGAPLPSATHASAACQAALDVQAAQAALRERWAKEGERWPARARAMRTRIGLNTGDAVVGNLGSKLRFNYTMMGDNVNLTQRLEAAAAFFGVDILTSASTQLAATQHDPDLIFRHLDRVTVPGRHKTVEIYELLGRRTDVTDKMQNCIDAHAAALAHYFRGEWKSACEGFQAAGDCERRQGKSNPSTVMLARCTRFLTTPPPPDWNFAYKLSKGD